MVLNIPPCDNVCSFSVGVDSESHDALLAEVQLLEATLGSIRQDLQGVMGCQGMGDRLDKLHDMVSCLLSLSLFYTCIAPVCAFPDGLFYSFE